ncbi:MAG: YeeE/YedE family protein [Verrucomicrobiales bacterium]|nr:YeeE/YedE family protein [Verrucomicrobiales bacterium]
MKEPNCTRGTCCDVDRAEAKARWNSYLVGVGIGVLSWFAFGLVNQPLGISTALSSASSVCAWPVMGSEGVANNAYWAKTPFKWDGGMLFLVGTFLGSLISVLVSRTFRLEKVPATWSQQFGGSTLKRLVAAFLGGVIIMFGARMAGGCTSGHGISGSLQLAFSSWTFFLTMFVFGIVTALVLFRKPANMTK